MSRMWRFLRTPRDNQITGNIQCGNILAVPGLSQVADILYMGLLQYYTDDTGKRNIVSYLCIKDTNRVYMRIVFRYLYCF